VATVWDRFRQSPMTGHYAPSSYARTDARRSGIANSGRSQWSTERRKAVFPGSVKAWRDADHAQTTSFNGLCLSEFRIL
jgi:hypothetical protein